MARGKSRAGETPAQGPVGGPAKPGDAGSFLKGEFTTALHEAFSFQKHTPFGTLASFPYNSIFPTFCNFWCHTLGGGYTCPVWKGGTKYHDSINIDPCAYTLGFDPGCTTASVKGKKAGPKAKA